MMQKIKAREIRLLFAVGALLIFAVASTHPGGGLTCCGTLEPDISVTFINSHTANEGLGLVPNIAVIILDTKTSGGQKTIKQGLKVGQSSTHSLPGGGFYIYTVFELEYSFLNPTKPDAVKCIDTGTIIDDATITIN